MTQQELSKLRNLPIEGVARRLGMEVNRHKALCPFHADSHPSLTFHTGRNCYHCFVCNASGGTIDLVMKTLNKSFREACTWLADQNNVILEQPMHEPKVVKTYPSDVDYLAQLVGQPWLCNEAKRFLFDERRIHPAVVKWCGITSIAHPTPCWRYGKPFYDAPALLIPYRNMQGQLMSVQSRYLGETSVENGYPIPRFRFPRNSNCTIYNLPILGLLKPDDELWITEGVTDCLAMLSSGRKAIAIPSATLLKPQDVALLSAFNSERFHIYPDQDAAGERLFLNLRDRFPGINRHQLPATFKDFGDYWKTSSTHL